MSELVSEERVSESAAEKALEELKAVAETKKEVDMYPCENEKVIKNILKFHKAMLKIKDVIFYRNAGKSAYINYITGARKSISGVHFSKSRARITMHTTDGKKATGNISIKITADGFFKDGEKITLKEIVRQVKQYKSDRGW